MLIGKSSTAYNENDRHHENPYGMGIFTRGEKIATACARSQNGSIIHSPHAPQTEALCRFHPTQKNFPQTTFRSVARTMNRSKTSESAVG